MVPQKILITLFSLCISKRCIKINIDLKILFPHFFGGASKGFMKALKDFTKKCGTTKKCEIKILCSSALVSDSQYYAGPVAEYLETLK